LGRISLLGGGTGNVWERGKGCVEGDWEGGRVHRPENEERKGMTCHCFGWMSLQDGILGNVCKRNPDRMGRKSRRRHRESENEAVKGHVQRLQ